MYGSPPRSTEAHSNPATRAALPPSGDAHAASLRNKVDAIGGHATLIRASDALRSAVDVFHPVAQGVAALNGRIKAGFDPQDVFNRGRLRRGDAA